MLLRLMFAMVLTAGAASAMAQMSDCQSSCEKNYKYCTTNKKTSDNACKVEYEKCRKKCAKAADKPSPT